MNPDNEALRYEIESALLMLRGDSTGINLEDIGGKNDEYIEIFTQDGKITLLPPFREYRGILYADTSWKGKKIPCKFMIDTLIYQAPLTLEFLDRESALWKKRTVTPLMAWRKPSVTTTPESREEPLPESRDASIIKNTDSLITPDPLIVPNPRVEDEPEWPITVPSSGQEPEEVREIPVLSRKTTPTPETRKEKKGFIPTLKRGISWIQKQFSKL
jgi:hypothetical protein